MVMLTMTMTNDDDDDDDKKMLSTWRLRASLTIGVRSADAVTINT